MKDTKRRFVKVTDGYEIPFNAVKGYYYKDIEDHLKNGFKYDAYQKACFPLEYFPKNSRTNDGHTTHINYTVHIKDITERRRKSKRDEIKTYSHFFYGKDYGFDEEGRKYNGLAKYGLTWDQSVHFLTTIEKCQCCGRHKDSLSANLNCDHCHFTGRVRGFICKSCNVVLGDFDDNIELLRKHHRDFLADYLERTKDVDLRETKVVIIVPTKEKLFGNKNETAS